MLRTHVALVCVRPSVGRRQERLERPILATFASSTNTTTTIGYCFAAAFTGTVAAARAVVPRKGIVLALEELERILVIARASNYANGNDAGVNQRSVIFHV